MRYYQLQTTLKPYMVLVRVGKSTPKQTLIYANSYASARQMAAQLFGSGNMRQVTQLVGETIKPPTPQQQKIKSYTDQAKRYRALAQQERANQALKKAQPKPATAIKPIKPISTK